MIETKTKFSYYRRKVNEMYSLYDIDTWIFKQLAVSKGDWILDIGCGTGKHLLKLSEIVGHTGDVVGIDIDAKSLSICKKDIKKNKLKNITLVEKDFTSLPHHSRGFNKILSSFAIYYTSDIDKTVEDCYNILNEEGILFFCGPEKHSNKELIKLVKRSGGDIPPNFNKWSRFLLDKAYKVLKKKFRRVKKVHFMNPVMIPNERVLFNYWKSTELYNPKIEKEMLLNIRKHFENDTHFANTKCVIGLRCVK